MRAKGARMTTTVTPPQEPRAPARARRFGRRARYDRLEAALQVAWDEIQHRDAAGATWKASALTAVSDAHAALEQGNIDSGWSLLHAARRFEILGCNDVEVAAAATALRAESDKLKAWRQAAVKALLGPANAPVTREALVEAAAIRDESYDNQGYKDRLLKTQHMLLAAILAAILLAIASAVYARRLPLEALPPAASISMLFGVMLFGNLGAAISAVLQASDTSGSARIPEITTANSLTLLRVLMGAGSAMVIYMALRSQVSDVFNPAFATVLKNVTSPAMYLVAFVSGFSERLVLRAVESIAGKAPATDQKSSK